MRHPTSYGLCRPWLKMGTVFLCLYTAALLAGCNNRSGTPQSTFNLTGNLVDVTTQQPIAGSVSGLPGGPYAATNGVINVKNITTRTGSPYAVVIAAPGYNSATVQVAAPTGTGSTVALSTVALLSSAAPIAGTVTGGYTTLAPIPDVGTTCTLTGSGQVTPFGQVQETGTIQSVGNIVSGAATGQLTLTNANGTVTLALIGPAQPGFSPPPTTFSYTVTGSTGKYKGVSASGNISLALVASAMAGTGQFTITFTNQTPR